LAYIGSRAVTKYRTCQQSVSWIADHGFQTLHKYHSSHYLLSQWFYRIYSFPASVDIIAYIISLYQSINSLIFTTISNKWLPCYILKIA